MIDQRGLAISSNLEEIRKSLGLTNVQQNSSTLLYTAQPPVLNETPRTSATSNPYRSFNTSRAPNSSSSMLRV